MTEFDRPRPRPRYAVSYPACIPESQSLLLPHDTQYLLEYMDYTRNMKELSGDKNDAYRASLRVPSQTNRQSSLLHIMHTVAIPVMRAAVHRHVSA